MKHILAVYDVDPVYAARFAEVVNQKEKIPFEVVAFSSIERLRAFAAEYPVKLLLLGEHGSGGRKGVHPGGKGYSFIGLMGENRSVRRFPVSTNTSPAMRLCAT